MTPDEQKHQNIIDFKMTFGSEHGKRVLGKLKAITGYYFFKDFKDKNGRIDPLAEMEQKGKQFLIMYIETQLNKDTTKDTPTQVKSEREL